MSKAGHDGIHNNGSRSAVIPATGRDSGIPFDRQNLVFAGAVASTVELPHRRPVVFGKSGRHRAYTPAAPGESRDIRPALKQKTGPQEITQKQARVLTFGVLS